MRTLSVKLPVNGYDIAIGPDILDGQLPPLVRAHATDLVVVVTNTTVDDLYPGRVARALQGAPYRVESCVLPDGEQYKTMDTLGLIFDRLMELGATRKTLVIAFGGGVVGDMAGFAAASFMRGVPLIQVPTTLLSQVDSSIGGKTGVNHPLGKNSIGAFKQPKGVVIDVAFLATLPQRELRAGLMELIKHGLIYDRELLAFLEANPEKMGQLDWPFWEEAVWRSCRVKGAVVEEDELEQGLRAILNFGHSLGHLLETHTGYTRYLHGEAVGVGMVFAAYLSAQWGQLSQPDYERVRGLLAPLLPTLQMARLDEAAFAGLLLHDKKTSQGGLRYVLLRGLGQALLKDGVTPQEVWPHFLAFCQQNPQLIQLG